MKYLVSVLVLLSLSSEVFAQSRSSQNIQTSTTLSSYVEYNEKSISITAPDGKMTYKSLRDLDTELEEATKLYIEEKYVEAFPKLVELSQWGIKKAQMLLGDMYIVGRHGEQSTIRGLAWLGVANEAKSEKHAKKLFKEVYAQLNEDQKKYVDTVVEQFIGKYGKVAQNYKCRKRTTVGSNIPQVECNKLPNTNSKLYPVS